MLTKSLQLHQTVSSDSFIMAFQNFTEFVRGNRSITTPEQLQAGRYPYIPIDARRFLTICQFIKPYIQRRKNFSSFLEVGCGPAINLLMMHSYFSDFQLRRKLKIHGLEIVDDYLEKARKLSLYTETIKGDALHFKHYNQYDFIYYYCPFSNCIMEEEFETLLEDQCKVRCILICCLKRSKRVEKDQRFKLIYERDISGSFSIYQKIRA